MTARGSTFTCSNATAVRTTSSSSAPFAKQLQPIPIRQPVTILKPVTVKIPAPLRPLTGNQAEVAVENAATVQAALEELARKYPGIKEKLLDDKGGLRRYVNLFKNDEDVRSGQRRGKLGRIAFFCPAAGSVQGLNQSRVLPDQQHAQGVRANLSLAGSRVLLTGSF